MADQTHQSELGFPSEFLWGASTAAHQIEGGNVNSDWWLRENSRYTDLSEPSGDAADSYHRYGDDTALLAKLGFNAYRFSVEWSRIEPERGRFSRASLAHYRRVIDNVLASGLTPVVTLHHFTNPRWFAAAGGWYRVDAADMFAHYVEQVAPILSDVEWVCTLNEPNMISLASGAAESVDAGVWRPEPDEIVTKNLIAAHRAASEVVKSSTGARSGWTIANQVYTPMPGFELETAEYRYPREDVFLEAARGDDFVGVQAYLRTFIGEGGPQPVPDETEKTLTGWEYFPDALGLAVRHTHDVTRGTPILITENGIATADDTRRIAYTRDALAGLHDAMRAGADVRGYLHWSALDNYEWGSYAPTFGLISWDKETFERTPKPSATWLGQVARSGTLMRDSRA